uniref:DDE Tnp4 domain-containing protein n=2 Tax=Bactrocera latifrons TaxID=174628 RepID=A0A0K8VVK0_BACLA
MKFTEVFIGCPGRCYDAAVWQNSPFKRSIANRVIVIPNNYHPLGDGAYPLEMNLMVPYRNNGFLTTQQSKFNAVLSSTRVFVEQAFGILKKKFRILKFIEVQRPQLPKIIIKLFHNIIIMNEGTDSEIDEDLQDDNENNNTQEAIHQSGQRT